jgi:hypothetical protein
MENLIKQYAEIGLELKESKKAGKYCLYNAKGLREYNFRDSSNSFTSAQISEFYPAFLRVKTKEKNAQTEKIVTDEIEIDADFEEKLDIPRKQFDGLSYNEAFKKLNYRKVAHTPQIIHLHKITKDGKIMMNYERTVTADTITMSIYDIVDDLDML